MNTVEAIVNCLGGEDVLGEKVYSELDLITIVRAGLSPSAISSLCTGLMFSQADIDRLVIPRRTLSHRIQKGETLSREESGRLARLALIKALALETFGSEDKAARWMHKPKQAYGGQSPIDLLDTDQGTRIVEESLGRIAHGIAA